MDHIGSEGGGRAASQEWTETFQQWVEEEESMKVYEPQGAARGTGVTE